MFREDFLVVLHIATTADEHQVCVSRETAEIIELAWIILDATKCSSDEQKEISKTFPTFICKESVLVRPSNSPVTDLCTSTTGLTWNDVSEAGSLADAVKVLQDSLQEHILAKQKSTLAFVVLDPWDLQTQLIRESKEKNMQLPDHLSYPRLYSIQEEFRQWHSRHPEMPAPRSSSCVSLCEALSIPPPRPAQPAQRPDGMTDMSMSGIRASETCTALQEIISKLMSDSEAPDNLFTIPFDAGADLKVFLKEESKILHLSGLAFDTTQSELESWFTQHGGRPIAFWTLRTPDQHKPTGLGFAVFATHDEARNNLSMNGRTLSDSTIRVSPSSTRILDRAGEILTPFPPSKNRPRPGDWTCPACGFSNFQRRTACFRCSYPVADHQPTFYGIHTMPPSMAYHPMSHATMSNTMTTRMGSGTHSNGLGGGVSSHVPFRAGDWSCQTCAYHNFARNSICLKCSMPRTQQEINGPGVQGYSGIYDANYSRMVSLTDDMARQML